MQNTTSEAVKVVPLMQIAALLRLAYCGEAGNLVAEPLGLNNCDLLNHPLVGVEVLSEPAIVLLDDDTRSLLDGLGANATL
jgi:hypothetical protein